jgi:hypothetical protein
LLQETQPAVSPELKEVRLMAAMYRQIFPAREARQRRLVKAAILAFPLNQAMKLKALQLQWRERPVACQALALVLQAQLRLKQSNRPRLHQSS